MLSDRLRYMVERNQLADDGSQTVTLHKGLLSFKTDSYVDVEDSRRWAHPTLYSEEPHVPFCKNAPQNIIITATRELELKHNKICVGLLLDEATTYTARDEVAAAPRSVCARATGYSLLIVLSDDMVDAFGSLRCSKRNPGLESWCASFIFRANWYYMDCIVRFGITLFKFCCSVHIDKCSILPIYNSQAHILHRGVAHTAGTPVQFTQTLDPVAGLVKGSIALVVTCSKHTVRVRLESGTE